MAPCYTLVPPQANFLSTLQGGRDTRACRASHTATDPGARAGAAPHRLRPRQPRGGGEPGGHPPSVCAPEGTHDAPPDARVPTASRRRRRTLAVSRADSRSEARAEAVGVGSSAWLDAGLAEESRPRASLPPCFRNAKTCHALTPPLALAPPECGELAWGSVSMRGSSWTVARL